MMDTVHSSTRERWGERADVYEKEFTRFITHTFNALVLVFAAPTVVIYCCSCRCSKYLR